MIKLGQNLSSSANFGPFSAGASAPTATWRGNFGTAVRQLLDNLGARWDRWGGLAGAHGVRLSRNFRVLQILCQTRPRRGGEHLNPRATPLVAPRTYICACACGSRTFCWYDSYRSPWDSRMWNVVDEHDSGLTCIGEPLAHVPVTHVWGSGHEQYALDCKARTLGEGSRFWGVVAAWRCAHAPSAL